MDWNKKSFTRLVWQLVWYISFAVGIIFAIKGGFVGDGVGPAASAFTLTWILWAIIVWIYWGFGKNDKESTEIDLSNNLHIKCPQCGRSLKGATREMLGDTGVCPKCKAEFVIEQK